MKVGTFASEARATRDIIWLGRNASLLRGIARTDSLLPSRSVCSITTAVSATLDISLLRVSASRMDVSRARAQAASRALRNQHERLALTAQHAIRATISLDLSAWRVPQDIIALMASRAHHVHK